MEAFPDSRAELLALCDRLLDGEMTPAERERLEALVLQDAAGPDVARVHVLIGWQQELPR